MHISLGKKLLRGLQTSIMHAMNWKITFYKNACIRIYIITYKSLYQCTTSTKENMLFNILLISTVIVYFFLNLIFITIFFICFLSLMVFDLMLRSIKSDVRKFKYFYKRHHLCYLGRYFNLCGILDASKG